MITEPTRTGHDLPVPPQALHTVISGNPDLDEADYLRIGAACANGIRGMLSRNGVEIEQLDRILDFGCGAARIIRHFNTLRTPKLYGTDINPQLIEWCRLNLPFADFQVNQAVPPLHYDNDQFDLVYAFSVFTHLSEAQQLAWLLELSRIIKRGGHLLLTTHGDAYADLLTANDRAVFEAGRPIVYNEIDAGNTDTYGRCCAFHPAIFVREQLAPAGGFDVIDTVAGTVVDASRRLIGQDQHLLRKR